jgi:hypothetical protein
LRCALSDCPSPERTHLCPTEEQSKNNRRALQQLTTGVRGAPRGPVVGVPASYSRPTSCRAGSANSG